MVVINCPFQRLLRPSDGAMSQNGCGPAGPGRPAVDPFADWESRFESGELDASLRHLDLSKPPPELPAPGGPTRPAVILQEQEDGRTEYRPPEPRMTIMKRPDAKDRAEGPMGVMGKLIIFSQTLAKSFSAESQSDEIGQAVVMQNLNRDHFDAATIEMLRNPDVARRIAAPATVPLSSPPKEAYAGSFGNYNRSSPGPIICKPRAGNGWG